MEQKPIKRSKELAPLSREHHEGLLFGWKIKQGLKNGTSLKRIASFVQWFWDNDLSDHFKKEENILIKDLPKEHEWVMKMCEEHEEIEALIQVIGMIPDEDIFLQLADAITNHIRFEERQLFPFVEEKLAPEKLKAIENLLGDKKQCAIWQDEFWVKEKLQ